MASRAKFLAIVAMLAAVYAAVSLIPGFPILGLSGSSIDFSRSLEIGYGLILGPILGPASAFLGAIVGKLVSGDSIGLIFTPLAIVSSFMAAALNMRYISKLKGWIFSASLLAFFIAAWYATPTGQIAIVYSVPHLIGLAIILIFREKITEYLHSKNKRKLTLGVILCSYPATMAGQMFGSIIFVLLFNPNPLFFIAVLPITIVERIVLTILATVVGVPLVLALRSASFLKAE